MDVQTATVLAIPAIGVIVWLVRLEGRINLGEDRHATLIDRLDRIEGKIDRISR